jgi:hypothetical protein
MEGQADWRRVDITQRTAENSLFECAVRIVRLCHSLDERPGVARTISQQLLRSGTSIGANVEEAQAGQSRADFRQAIGFVCLRRLKSCPKHISPSCKPRLRS